MHVPQGMYPFSTASFREVNQMAFFSPGTEAQVGLWNFFVFRLPTYAYSVGAEECSVEGATVASLFRAVRKVTVSPLLSQRISPCRSVR